MTNFFKMKYLLLSLLFSVYLQAQSTSEVAINPIIKGTLFTPETSDAKTLIILIAGSGPTNRSGNSVGNHNNSLLYLSQELSKNGISVFSFDKRVVANIIAGKNEDRELLFSNQIDDVKDIIDHFKKLKKFQKIVIAGHSEGSLIGMIAAKNNTDGYISLAGAGRTIDKILTDQLLNQMPALKADLELSFDQLSKGEKITSTNGYVRSLFRGSVQPFLKSWIALDPQKEIKKLQMPVLIINGTKDYQVKESEAHLLKAAKPDAKLVLIPNMNHIFKEISGGDDENLASYNNPQLPIMPELVSTITNFIQSLQK